MSSVIYQSAQRIIKQIFEWSQTSQSTRTSELISDTFMSGIDNATQAGEGFLIVPGTNNTSSTPTVNVTLGGIAYDPTGSRIFVSFSDITLYNSSNPSTTTNDGTGIFVSTPQSTGVINVPVTQSSQNYLWIDYLATIDTAAFTLNKETNAKQFYKQTDGYNIVVTTTNVAPGSNSIYLANINMLGGGAVALSNISQVGRSYFNILPNIVPVVTPQANRSDATVTYNPASSYTLEAHIKAVGTSPTGVSPTNPHAMTLADLGIGPLDTVVGHRQLEHGNAIIAGVPGTPYPTTSAMATSINIVNPGSDYLTVHQLLSTEFAIVNGTAYNVTDIFGAIPTDAHIFFPNASGTYNIYWDSVVKAFSLTTSDISGDNTKLWIATATYTFVGTGPSDHNALSALIDRRRVGSTTHLLQRWITSARPGVGTTQPNSGEFGFNLTTNLLEYWDGTQWQQPITVAQNSTVPSGAYFPFAGVSAPAGFLLCNGASYPTATYPNLFAVVGYLYGGSGPNFNVPTTANLIPIGAGSIAALGVTAGAATASDTVTPTEAAHQHISGSIGVAGAIVVATGSGAGSWPFGESNVTTASTAVAATNDPSSTSPYLNTSTETATINPVTVTVSTIQPVLGATYIIKF